jgi:hypothetical protein
MKTDAAIRDAIMVVVSELHAEELCLIFNVNQKQFPVTPDSGYTISTTRFAESPGADRGAAGK